MPIKPVITDHLQPVDGEHGEALGWQAGGVAEGRCYALDDGFMLTVPLQVGEVREVEMRGNLQRK